MVVRPNHPVNLFLTAGSIRPVLAGGVRPTRPFADWRSFTDWDTDRLTAENLSPGDVQRDASGAPVQGGVWFVRVTLGLPAPPRRRSARTGLSVMLRSGAGFQEPEPEPESGLGAKLVNAGKPFLVKNGTRGFSQPRLPLFVSFSSHWPETVQETERRGGSEPAEWRLGRVAHRSRLIPGKRFCVSFPALITLCYLARRSGFEVCWSGRAAPLCAAGSW